MVCVFEGILGYLDPLDEPASARLLKAGEFPAALRLWKLSDLATRIIWDRVYRCSQCWYLVTFLGTDDRLARALAEKVSQAGIPVRTTWAVNPGVFSRSLVAMPDVVRVYDPFPGHAGLYPASVGRQVTDIRQLGVI
jgi:hypothetical protein